MRWSKLKKLVESGFTDELKNRIAIHSTRYGNCSCGHAWLTLDNDVIANFCTRAFWIRARGHYYRENGQWKTDAPVPEHVSESQKKKYGAVEYGELSRQDADQSCWAFVHELSIEEALSIENPLIQSLAVLDSRVGKRRLKNIDASKLHPLAKKLRSIRLEATKSKTGRFPPDRASTQFSG